jgi:hypothetical protein
MEVVTLLENLRMASPGNPLNGTRVGKEMEGQDEPGEEAWQMSYRRLEKRGLKLK